MRDNSYSGKGKKHSALVQTATELFLHHGIKKVTVEEICEKSGVSKMTFYKYFKNKVDLARFILDEIFDKGIERYRKIMAQDVPYSEKAREIVKMKLDVSEEFSKEMLQDCYDGSIPELTGLIQEKLRLNTRLLLDDVVVAQEKGEIRRDINPQFIIYMINRMKEMASDEALLNMYGSTQALVSEFINFFFYGILPREDP